MKCPSYFLFLSFPQSPGAFPKNDSKYLSLETLNSVYPYLILRLTVLHTNNKSWALRVIYNIGAISHLLQEIKRQRKREGGRKKKIPHPACENLCQISPQTRSPSLGLASMPWLGNRIRCRTATNLFLSQRRCPLGLHAHCVNNTSLFLFISLVCFHHKTLLFLWKNSRSCV